MGATCRGATLSKRAAITLSCMVLVGPLTGRPVCVGLGNDWPLVDDPWSGASGDWNDEKSGRRRLDLVLWTHGAKTGGWSQDMPQTANENQLVFRIGNQPRHGFLTSYQSFPAVESETLADDVDWMLGCKGLMYGLLKRAATVSRRRHRVSSSFRFVRKQRTPRVWQALQYLYQRYFLERTPIVNVDRFQRQKKAKGKQVHSTAMSHFAWLCALVSAVTGKPLQEQTLANLDQKCAMSRICAVLGSIDDRRFDTDGVFLAAKITHAPIDPSEGGAIHGRANKVLSTTTTQEKWVLVVCNISGKGHNLIPHGYASKRFFAVLQQVLVRVSRTVIDSQLTSHCSCPPSPAWKAISGRDTEDAKPCELKFGV
ncbi:hypothetical protein B0T13DRAFT_501957 [Neurospora crassa]|nr:hypothetical protein B0T13DRAFT_501957 [Neurospora crassa]